MVVYTGFYINDNIINVYPRSYMICWCCTKVHVRICKLSHCNVCLLPVYIAVKIPLLDKSYYMYIHVYVVLWVTNSWLLRRIVNLQ